MANLELTSDIVGSRTMPCCDPTGLAVGFFAFPSKSRALAEDFSASTASALQAAPVHQDSVQNLLTYCTHWFFFSCLLFKQKHTFPRFSCIIFQQHTKMGLEMQQNALWSCVWVNTFNTKLCLAPWLAQGSHHGRTDLAQHFCALSLGVFPWMQRLWNSRQCVCA